MSRTVDDEGVAMRAITTALVLGVVLTGCAAEPAPQEVREGPGPLSEIAMSGGLRGNDAASVIADMTHREEAVAACMHEAGFDYHLQVPQPDQMTFHPDDAEILGPIEFAERYGYGIWNPPDNAGGVEFNTTVDPEHAAYLASMSETEAEVYETALWGPILEEGQDGSVIRDGGCRGRQWEPPAQDEAERAHLLGVAEEMNAFLADLAEDPAFDDLSREWSACLREAGYEVARPEDARAQVHETFESALSAADHRMTAAMVAEHGSAEIALATADALCRDQVDYDARHAAIQWDLEQEYVDAHTADLEAYRQAVAAWQPTGG